MTKIPLQDAMGQAPEETICYGLRSLFSNDLAGTSLGGSTLGSTTVGGTEAAPAMRAKVQRLGRSLGNRDGSVLIETAVVMILITTVFFGIFEFSMALTSYCSATYAVRAGARFASLHSFTSLRPAAQSDIQNVVNATLFMPAASGQNITVTYIQYGGAGQGNYTGNVVEVNLKWNQRVTIPGYSATFPVQSSMYRAIVR